MEIRDFKVGQIYKMNVGERSYVKQPYYIEIIKVGEDYIVTNIPKEHSLTINFNNWKYQTSRMELVPHQNKKLLHNQKLN